MSTLERQLQDSLLSDDEAFVTDMRLQIDARALTPGAYAVEGDSIARLLRLAEEAVRTRKSRARPEPTGPIGRVIALRDGDDQARLVATIEFDDEDDLRAAGRFIASRISLEPIFEGPAAANDGTTPGQGSLDEEEEVR
ncbi:MAG: hypothetical protein ACK4X1_10250 [Terricaulis sp.]